MSVLENRLDWDTRVGREGVSLRGRRGYLGFLHVLDQRGEGWPGDRPLRSYSVYSLIVVTKGTLRIGLETGEELELRAGDLYEGLPGMVRSARVDREQAYGDLLFGCDEATYELLYRLELLPVAQNRLLKAKGEGVQFAFEKFYDWMAVNQSTDLFPAIARAERFLSELLENVRTGSDRDFDERVRRAARILEENLEQNVRIQTLWSPLGEDYEALRKRFREVVGMSPGKYRLRWRMSLAQRLLQERHSVAAVAERLGYSDAFAFSKRFKSVMGLPPSAFRR